MWRATNFSTQEVHQTSYTLRGASLGAVRASTWVPYAVSALEASVRSPAQPHSWHIWAITLEMPFLPGSHSIIAGRQHAQTAFPSTAETNHPSTCRGLFDTERSTQNIENVISFMTLSIAKYGQMCKKNDCMESNKFTSLSRGVPCCCDVTAAWCSSSAEHGCVGGSCCTPGM